MENFKMYVYRRSKGKQLNDIPLDDAYDYYRDYYIEVKTVKNKLADLLIEAKKDIIKVEEEHKNEKTDN